MDIPPELDPRRPIVEVMARIGRETQLTLDERERHFKITDAVIVVISVLLIILAVVNIYYVRVLYQDLDRIVGNMESMVTRLKRVDHDMSAVADHVDVFEQKLRNMGPLTAHVTAVTGRLPEMRKDMTAMARGMNLINQDMGLLLQAVSTITPNMVQMTGNIARMRVDVGRIADPMGAFNPILP